MYVHVENERRLIGHQHMETAMSTDFGVWRRAEALKGESEKVQDPTGNTHI